MSNNDQGLDPGSPRQQTGIPVGQRNPRVKSSSFLISRILGDVIEGAPACTTGGEARKIRRPWERAGVSTNEADRGEVEVLEGKNEDEDLEPLEMSPLKALLNLTTAKFNAQDQYLSKSGDFKLFIYGRKL